MPPTEAARPERAQPARVGFIAGDPVRAIAALTVFLFHAANAGTFFAFGKTALSGYGPAGAVLNNLDLGLYLFFILSGYLLAGPFVTALVHGRELPNPWRYVRNRALRIVPAFWAVFTLLLLRHTFLPDAFPPGNFSGSLKQIGAIYLFVQTYIPSKAEALMGQAWTLDVEAVYYLLLPVAGVILALLVRRVPSLRARAITILAFIVVAGGASLLFRHLSPHTLPAKRSFPAMFLAFVPGIALALAETAIPERLRTAPRVKQLALGLVPTGLLLFLVYYLVAPRIDSFAPRAPAIRLALAALGAGALVGAPMLWQWSTGTCWAILDNPMLRWLGQRSYSFYLIQEGIIFEFKRLIPGHGEWYAFGLLLALALPASLVLAHLSYTYIERPFLALKGSRKTAPA